MTSSVSESALNTRATVRENKFVKSTGHTFKPPRGSGHILWGRGPAKDAEAKNVPQRHTVKKHRRNTNVARASLLRMKISKNQRPASAVPPQKKTCAPKRRDTLAMVEAEEAFFEAREVKGKY